MGSKTPFLGECLYKCVKKARIVLKKRQVLAGLALAAVAISLFHLGNLQPELYAQAQMHALEGDRKISLKETIGGNDNPIIIDSAEEAQCEQIKEDPLKKEAPEDTSGNLEKKIYDMVGDAPIKEMVPYIAEHDLRVAALIVGIAKKESNWGSASPSKNGQDCYNYWGYKGAGSRGTSMGYGCFASAEEGVDAIGGRIGELVDKNISTPSRMVVWKCGSSCAGHDPKSVQKWISDVDTYFRKIVSLEG